MTKFNFQFQQDKYSTRPCRMLVTLLEGRNTFVVRQCVVMDDKCEGRLYNRPEWCPLVEENENIITEAENLALTISEANEVLAVGKSLNIVLDDNGWDK